MTHQMDRGMAILALSGYKEALCSLAAYRARQAHPEGTSIWDINYIGASMISDAIYDDSVQRITGDAILHYHYKCGTTKLGERISAVAQFKYIINVDNDLQLTNARFDLM